MIYDSAFGEVNSKIFVNDLYFFDLDRIKNYLRKSVYILCI